MKILKLQPEIIFDNYAKEVQPLINQGVVVWNSSLTKAKGNDLERIQKALRIILADDYTSYDNTCSALSVDPNVYSVVHIFESNCIEVTDGGNKLGLSCAKLRSCLTNSAQLH